MKAIVLSIFLMLGVSLAAQTSAEGYFNSGAKDFIHSEIEKATATIDEGLKKYPNDEKLNSLKRKLIEEKKKKDQQKKDDQNKKDQENKDRKKDQDQKNNDQNKDKKDDQNKKDQEKNKQDNKENQKPEQPQPQPQVGQMTPEQVKQLLETMNNEEAKTQKKVNAQKVKGKKVQQEKDW
ncbi:hypothetical protein [Flavicella marina]|uniref:hypothetical protein n=1 Tax=Flavicella marina TaxID=1475951 RepID=UPI0012644F40|nr:hypothetical protein [Flavicella marina]